MENTAEWSENYMKKQIIKPTLEFELQLETPDIDSNGEEWEWLEAIETFDAEEAINFWGIYRPIRSTNTGRLEVKEIRRAISGEGYERMKEIQSDWIKERIEC